jgi:hypothetical protein
MTQSQILSIFGGSALIYLRPLYISYMYISSKPILYVYIFQPIYLPNLPINLLYSTCKLRTSKSSPCSLLILFLQVLPLPQVVQCTLFTPRSVLYTQQTTSTLVPAALLLTPLHILYSVRYILSGCYAKYCPVGVEVVFFLSILQLRFDHFLTFLAKMTALF